MRYPKLSEDNSEEDDLEWDDPQQERGVFDLFVEQFKQIFK